MTYVSNSLPQGGSLNQEVDPEISFYALYDSCIINDIPTWDLAFIEQRLMETKLHERNSGNEKYFSSLKDAKAYAKDHFQSGAEYFSLNQANDPNNILYTIIDKITYLIA